MAKEESTKIKKKKWYPILAPRLFGEKIIGESLLAESKVLQGRAITCNLMSLTNDIKSQNIYVKFVITDVRENKAFTEPVSYTVSPTHIKRMVRRGKERIDDSYVFKTKDARIVRIKPFLLTNSSANKSVLTKIRKALKQRIFEIITQNNYDIIFEGVVSLKVQREIKAYISKIFPIRTVEIRVLKEEKEKAGKIKHEEAIEEEITEEEEIEEEVEQEEQSEEEVDEDSEEELEEEKPRKKTKKKDADETSD